MDEFSQILRQIDESSPVPTVSENLAARVIQRAARRRTRRHSAALAAIAIALATTLRLVQSPPQSSTAAPVYVESAQIAQLTADDILALRRAEPARPIEDPLVRLNLQIDQAAAMLMQIGQTSSGSARDAAYRQVIELFPQSSSAQDAARLLRQGS